MEGYGNPFIKSRSHVFLEVLDLTLKTWYLENIVLFIKS